MTVEYACSRHNALHWDEFLLLAGLSPLASLIPSLFLRIVFCPPRMVSHDFDNRRINPSSSFACRGTNLFARHHLVVETSAEKIGRHDGKRLPRVIDQSLAILQNILIFPNSTLRVSSALFTNLRGEVRGEETKRRMQICEAFAVGAPLPPFNSFNVHLLPIQPPLSPLCRPPKCTIRRGPMYF